MLIGQNHSLIGDLPQAFACSLEEILYCGKVKSRVYCHDLVQSQEYRAMVNVTCEMVDLLIELDFAPECPMRLYCDNQVAIHIAENLVFH